MNKEQLKQWRESREGLAAQLAPETLDKEQRTVDVVWFTGIDVPRYDWRRDEMYLLRFDPKGADLSLLNNGAPVLDNHSMWGSDSQKGRVEKAWSDKSQYLATLRFSRRPEVEGLWQDIQDKIATKFSMGVQLLELKELPREKATDTRVVLATKWQPYEISVAPIPADFGTTTLTAEIPSEAPPASETNNPQGATAHEELQMTEKITPGAAEAPKPEPVQSNEAELKAEVAKQERGRVLSIQNRVRLAGLSETFAAQLVNDGTTLEAAGDAIFAELAKEDKKRPETRSHVTMNRDEADTRREAMTVALMHRYQPGTQKLTDAARQFRGLTLMEMARECVIVMGKSPAGMSRSEIAELALHSTSDFPNILADVANKSLRQGYEQAPRTFLPIAKRATATDFKQMNRLLLGEMPQLLKVNESGEVTMGTVGESKVAYGLVTYARRVGITRRVIINDDLDAFTKIPAGYGMQAANLQSDTVWAIITANANMPDGVALFHATHGNLAGTNGAIGVDTVGDARAGMAKQKGIDKKTILNIRPKFLVTPSALETKAEQFVSANLLPQQPSQAVPASLRSLTPIAEPRLDANSLTAWYLFGDPNQIDTIEYAFLEGEEEVRIETRVGFEVDGVEVKASLDFGAAAIDHRAMYKNSGV